MGLFIIIIVVGTLFLRTFVRADLVLLVHKVLPLFVLGVVTV